MRTERLLTNVTRLVVVWFLVLLETRLHDKNYRWFHVVFVLNIFKHRHDSGL